MKQLIKIAFISLFFGGGIAHAQDMHFTQFYASRLYLNPAFTGAGTCSRFAATYRNQWAGVPNGYSSYLFSFDHYLHKEKVGIGILFGNDVAGSGDLKRTVINPLIAYESRVSRHLVIRFGIQPGIGFVSVNYNGLLFGDQIARGGALTDVPTIETPFQNIVYYDVGAGLLAYGKDFWGGISFYHLLQPVEGLIGPNSEDLLSRKFSFHGGYKFKLNDVKEENKKQFASFALNYRSQNKFDQLDIGGYFVQGVFNFGLWYRGLPGLKAYAPGYGNSDAIAVVLGIRNARMNIGYSYDLTISKLTNASRGAHEITLSHNFCDPNQKRKVVFPVPCPKF